VRGWRLSPFRRNLQKIFGSVMEGAPVGARLHGDSEPREGAASGRRFFPNSPFFRFCRFPAVVRLLRGLSQCVARPPAENPQVADPFDSPGPLAPRILTCEWWKRPQRGKQEAVPPEDRPRLPRCPSAPRCPRDPPAVTRPPPVLPRTSRRAPSIVRHRPRRPISPRETLVPPPRRFCDEWPVPASCPISVSANLGRAPARRGKRPSGSLRPIPLNAVPRLKLKPPG